MSRQTARQRRVDELADIRQRLICAVQEVCGAALSDEQARDFLAQAHAWAPPNARELGRHLGDHPDAFTAPSPYCPLSLAQLLRLLASNGFGDYVVLLGCARCGRCDKLLKRRTPEGRCCERCLERIERRPCARCGETARIVTHRPDGPICRRCYLRDPARQTACSRCDENSAPVGRTEAGGALCRRCAPKSEKPCVECGQVGIVSANTPKGPVCKRCYTSPPRRCGVCGQTRPIQRRGDGKGAPDTCYRCANIGDCVSCGQRRHGSHYRAGPFYCNNCVPKAARLCAICGALKPITANWPLGPVCGSCYRARRNHPQPCAECSHTRILACINDSGESVCTTCAGADLNFACRTCGEEGPGFRDGQCYRCLTTEKVTELLGGADASALARVQPLIAALATAHPDSVGHWVADRTSAGILADLATSGAELTHEELDKLPQNGRTHYLRELLVAVGLLPRRNESLAQLQLWVDRTVATLPAPHQTLIRAYAEWYIVRRARQRAARGPFRPTADRSNRSRIQAAINFLAWLDSAGTSAAELTQHHIDTYLDTRPSNIAALLTFVSWMLDRRIITDIEITRPKDGLPQRFQDHDEHTAQLRRCLIDDSLPLEIRIIGALIRLYAIPAVRIVELTADRFCRDETYAYLVGDQNPVVLPPSLAQLIEAQIDKGGPSSMLRNQNLDGPRYLFPGRPASRHRNVHSVLRGLSQHGLATLTARNTAMITNVLELDAVVVSDLYGVAPQTAHKWAQYVQASWAAYLSAGR